MILFDQWLIDARELSAFWFALVAIVAMSTVVPKTVVSIACGTLFSPVLGCGLIVVIATSAAMVNYTIGRRFSVERLLGKVDDASKLTAAALVLSDADFFVHLLVRLSPVPSMMISTLCGALQCRLVPYFFAALAASVTQWLWVWAAATTAAAATNGGWVAWSFSVVALTAAVSATVIISGRAARRTRLDKQSFHSKNDV